jgi:hypothetical protein
MRSVTSDAGVARLPEPHLDELDASRVTYDTALNENGTSSSPSLDASVPSSDDEASSTALTAQDASVPGTGEASSTQAVVVDASVEGTGEYTGPAMTPNASCYQAITCARADLIALSDCDAGNWCDDWIVPTPSACISLGGTQAVANDPPVAKAGDACRVGVGACAREGVLQQVDGGLACDATPAAPGAELCNGLDDDCNGSVDDGLADSVSDESVVHDSQADATMRTTWGGVSTACFVEGNDIHCTDPELSEPRTESIVFTAAGEPSLLDFTFAPDGSPLFCYSEFAADFTSTLLLAYRDADTGQYVSTQVTAGNVIKCNIELDGGVVRVEYVTSDDAEQQSEMDWRASCDSDLVYAPLQTNLEAPQAIYHVPEPRAEGMPAQTYPVARTYPENNAPGDPELRVDMGIFADFFTQIYVPISASYALRNPGVVVLPDGRLWVTFTEWYNSPMLMCGNDCQHVQVKISRTVPFDPWQSSNAATSTIVDDASAIDGGLVRDASGAVRQIYWRDGKLYQVFICG